MQIRSSYCLSQNVSGEFVKLRSYIAYLPIHRKIIGLKSVNVFDYWVKLEKILSKTALGTIILRFVVLILPVADTTVLVMA